MFTGIVEETGEVKAIRRTKAGIRLVVAAKVCAGGTAKGDSVAVNGCCLTVVKRQRKGARSLLHFDLLLETWHRTNLSVAKVGSPVNLERSLAANGRFGGHFVTGHIDGLGTIANWRRAGADHILEITAPREILHHVVFKGSIAIDGISLTVAKVLKGRFRLWIIPHTYAVTTLRDRGVGDPVNLEADILGKYVERFVRTRKRR